MRFIIFFKNVVLLLIILAMVGCNDNDPPNDSENTPPTTPSILDAIQFSAGSVEIRWLENQDDTGVTGYRVFRDGNFIAEVATTAYTDTGLSESGSHCYTVSAVDSVGNESSQSTAVCIDKIPGNILWKYETQGVISGAPAISEDGTIYVASQDGCLYALSPDGTLQWIFNTNASVINHSSPAVSPDGTIYLGSTEYLHAINPDGSPKWHYMASLYSTPAVGKDGTVYVGDRTSSFYAISPEGLLKWKKDSNGTSLYPPAIGPDGVIYASWSTIYAVQKDSTVKWTLPFIAYHDATPAIGSSGQIYVGANFALYACTSDGEINWSINITSNTSIASVKPAFGERPSYFYNPVTGSDGTVYATSREYSSPKYLYAITPEGTVNWKVDLAEDDSYNTDSSVPAIGDTGIIYLQQHDGYFTAFNTDGTIKWQTYTGGDSSSPAIAGDGTIYVGSLDHCLYALDSESQGLAASSCPKIFKDQYNTSNYENTTGSDSNLPSAPSDIQGSVLSPSMTSLTWDTSAYTDGQITEYQIYRNGEYIGLSGSGGYTDTGLSPSTRYCYGIRAVDESGNISDVSPEICLETRPQAADGELKWKVNTGMVNGKSLAIGEDGAIYLSSTDGYGYAINKNGTVRWRKSNWVGRITVSRDDTLYASKGWPDYQLVSFKADGDINWQYPIDGLALMVAEDGTVYLRSQGDSVTAITPEGQLKWQINDLSTAPVAPGIAANSTLYVVTSDRFIAISPEGAILWQYEMEPYYATNYAIGEEGTIYLSSDSQLCALNPDGSVKWEYSGSPYSQLCGSIIVGTNDMLYIGGEDGFLYAFDKNGTLQWSYFLTAEWDLTDLNPVLAADDIIYVALTDGYLHAIRTDGTLKWKNSLGENYLVNSPALDSDGTLYVGAYSGYIYAIQTDSPGLADTPWPKACHDNQNTGRNPL